jgi:hypothetical protein
MVFPLLVTYVQKHAMLLLQLLFKCVHDCAFLY